MNFFITFPTRFLFLFLFEQLISDILQTVRQQIPTVYSKSHSHTTTMDFRLIKPVAMYASLESRISSFVEIWKLSTKEAKTLVEAGLYSLPAANYAGCFYCKHMK